MEIMWNDDKKPPSRNFMDVVLPEPDALAHKRPVIQPNLDSDFAKR
jgi:hypothetical protein